VEGLQAVELFGDADELDRPADDMASPSSLVTTTPSSGRRWWKALEEYTASWPVIASITR
jgi:hypothetical protein